ncbi:hypothetical protein ACFOGI_05890 [Virgibacillus xinjiangensis]|uniref:Uncharacterized protein n=1 Tax=Virgibacillus xinjiangensis TaxID=393090 RepID=A0ABV7CTQ0_9BACI
MKKWEWMAYHPASSIPVYVETVDTDQEKAREKACLELDEREFHGWNKIKLSKVVELEEAI